MPLYHNDDQAMLAETVTGFMSDEGAISKQLRRWRDDCDDGFGHELWKKFAEMGLTGMLVPEADGGLGMGHVEAGIVLTEIGRNLTPSPFLTTSVMATTALAEGSDEVRGRWLPGIAGDDSLVRRHCAPARAPAREAARTADRCRPDKESTAPPSPCRPAARH